MSDEKRSMERRTFLCVLGAAGVTAGLGTGCGSDPPPPPFSAGNASGHAVGVWRLFGGSRAIVGRDANGFFAYSATCTHESTTIAFRTNPPVTCATVTGCSSQSSTGETECPLHFSRYDGGGAVTRGPSTTDLPHFQVTVSATGEITVNPGVTVAASARTPAP